MGLPWVRLDASLPFHDKTIALLGLRGGKGSLAVYVCALAWAGHAATDGRIPKAALPIIHGVNADAVNLVAVGMWDPDPDGDGWWIRNWQQRQESSDISAAKRDKARNAALTRWHGGKEGAVHELRKQMP